MKKTHYTGALIFLSAIAGGFAAPLKTLFHHFLKIPGLFSTYYDEFSYHIIYGNSSPLRGFWYWIFGEIGDIIIGALFGIGLGLWLYSSPPKYHWWIGLMFGLVMWFATLFLGNLLQIIDFKSITPPSLLGHMLTMLIYGVNFVLIAHYWKPLKKLIMSQTI